MIKNLEIKDQTNDKNLIYKLWYILQKQSIHVKLAILGLALIIVATPKINNQILTNNQEAASLITNDSQTPSPNTPAGSYVPGEVIIKLKSSLPPLAVSGSGNSKGINLDQEGVSPSELDPATVPYVLNSINKLYNIQKIEKVFKGTQDPQTETNNYKNSFNTSTSNGDHQINESLADSVDLSRIYKITFNSSVSVKQIVSQLEKDASILYAEPNYIFHSTDTMPNDPYFLDQYPANTTNRDPKWNPNYDYQWDMKIINMPKAWDITKGNSNITVAIVDSGVDYTQPELGGCTLTQVNNNTCARITPGYNFVNYNTNPDDDLGHGTHVAGTIGAITNNGVGMSGMDWNVKIMPVKSLDSQGVGEDDKLSEGIVYAAKNGANVINMSWGGQEYAMPLLQRDALDYAYARNVVLIAAAGNESSNIGGNFYSGFYPAAYARVIAVSATDQNDKLAPYSNYGQNVDIAAPGGDLSHNIVSLKSSDSPPLGPLVGSCCVRLSGTSMAAPHVSGLASLILAKYYGKGLSNEQVRGLINEGADKINGTGTKFRNGRIDVANSLAITTTPPVAQIDTPSPYTDVFGHFLIKGAASGYSNSSNTPLYSIDVGQSDYSGSGPTTWQTKGISLTNSNGYPKVDGNLATWDTSSYAQGYWVLRLTVTTGDNTISTSIPVFVVRDVNKGWPVKLSGTPTQYVEGQGAPPEQLTIANLFNNGKKQIVTADQTGKLYAFNGDGTTVNGWNNVHIPTQTNTDSLNVFRPAVGKLYDDGKSYVAIGTGFNPAYSPLYIYDANGKPDPLWNPDILGKDLTNGNGSTFLTSEPVLADLNGDGKKEIIVSTYTTNLNTWFYAIHVFTYSKSAGWHEMSGWPRISKDANGVSYPSSIAVGSINSNGKNKVIILASSAYEMVMLDKSNHPLQGWPIRQPSNTDYSTFGGMLLADVMGNNTLNPIINLNFKTYAYSMSGKLMATVNTDFSPIAGVKIPGKSGIKIALGHGELLDFSNASNPIMWDISSNVSLEGNSNVITGKVLQSVDGPQIVSAGNENSVNFMVLLDLKGKIIKKLDIDTQQFDFYSIPEIAMADLKNTGEVNLIVETEGEIFVYTIPNEIVTKKDFEWPQADHDEANSSTK